MISNICMAFGLSRGIMPFRYLGVLMFPQQVLVLDGALKLMKMKFGKDLSV